MNSMTLDEATAIIAANAIPLPDHAAVDAFCERVSQRVLSQNPELFGAPMSGPTAIIDGVEITAKTRRLDARVIPDDWRDAGRLDEAERIVADMISAEFQAQTFRPSSRNTVIHPYILVTSIGSIIDDMGIPVMHFMTRYGTSKRLAPVS